MPVYAGIIARLINLSVAHTHIPTQWKTSIIPPIPKIQQPVTPIDYRPISITLVLSRLLERFIHSFILKTYCPYLHLSDLQHSSFESPIIRPVCLPPNWLHHCSPNLDYPTVHFSLSSMNPMCPFSHSISVKRSTRCDTRLWLVNSPRSISQMKSTTTSSAFSTAALM